MDVRVLLYVLKQKPFCRGNETLSKHIIEGLVRGAESTRRIDYLWQFICSQTMHIHAG